MGDWGDDAARERGPIESAPPSARSPTTRTIGFCESVMKCLLRAAMLCLGLYRACIGASKLPRQLASACGEWRRQETGGAAEGRISVEGAVSLVEAGVGLEHHDGRRAKDRQDVTIA